MSTITSALLKGGIMFGEYALRCKYAFVASMLGLLVPTMSHAAATSLGGSTTGNEDQKYALPNPIKFNSVDELIKAGTTIIVRILLVMAVLYFIYAGFLYVTALDNEKKLESARTTLVNAAIGTAILVSLNLILELVKGTFRAVGVQGI